MKDIDYILDFAAAMGSRMLACGANLERANDSMIRVCRSYGLEEISIFSLSSIIQISAKDAVGERGYCQVAVPGMDIHLFRLNRLNQLSRRVCSEKPSPASLEYLLTDAQKTEDYPTWLVLIGRLIAMVGMCVLYDGTVRDVLSVVFISFLLFWMVRACSRVNLNHIILNLVCMLFAGSLGLLLYHIGLADQYFIVIITCSMMLLPGIPLVNAVRNLLCGNEMNGILETLKAALETLAIVLGLVASIALFGSML